MRKVVEVIWKNTSRQTIGIVAAEDEHTKKWKAFIDVVDGLDEDYDANYVKDHGAKLSQSEAAAFFPILDINLFEN